MKSTGPSGQKMSAKLEARDKKAGMTRDEIVAALQGVPAEVQVRVDVGLGGQIRALRLEWRA